MGIRATYSSLPLPSVQIHAFSPWPNGSWAINPWGSQCFYPGHSQHGVCWWKRSVPGCSALQKSHFYRRAEQGFMSLFSILRFSSFYPNPQGSVYCQLEHLLKFWYWSDLELQKAIANKTPLSADSENSLLSGSNKKEVTESWVHWTCTHL